MKLIPKDYWPSCTHSPKTLSFRHSENDTLFKTLNSVYFDDSISDNNSQIENTTTSSSSNNNNNNNNSCNDNKDIESIVRRAHSDSTRLFFEPSAGKTLSSLALPAEPSESESESELELELDSEPFKESLVMAMESDDPYTDFKKSMEEMMEAHGMLKDWACLEDLLTWYLRVNGKKNHTYIVAAFVDLLVKFSSSSSNSTNSDDLNSSSLNVSSCSTSRSSSSLCTCDYCRDLHQQHRLVMAKKSNCKSTTSFSSAASSFSSSDEAGDHPA